jgi:DNA-binding MarR family transcriptional regulator
MQGKLIRMQGKLSRTQTKSPNAATIAAVAPELEPFALSIPHAVTRLFREQNRLHGRAVKRFGLSTEQAHLLLVLWTYGPMTMTELGKEVALSSGTLSTAIDRMEAAKLVSRVVDSTDRRITRVVPASWTKAKRTQLTEALLETEEVILKPLSASERTTLHRLLGRVLTGLEK